MKKNFFTKKIMFTNNNTANPTITTRPVVPVGKLEDLLFSDAADCFGSVKKCD